MNIIQMLVPDQYVFPNFWGNTPRWLILHKTAGFHTAQDVAAYFQSGSNGLEVSSHYVVGQDGAVVQCVRETDGAGANGVLEAGHDAWWSGNPNLVTYSFEHVDPSSDNSTPLTDAQKAASFQLVHDVCARRNIPMRPADANGGITGHYSIDPLSRAHCPGNYPWDELWAYLKGATYMPVPTNWKDTNGKLTAPNGHYLVHGFRDHVLNALSWDGNDMPLEEEQSVSQVELHANSGAGSRQLTNGHLLIWTQAKGVKESATGAEIARCYNIIAQLEQQVKTLQTQIATLKTTLPVTPANIGESVAPLQAMIANMTLLEQEVIQALDVQKVTTQHVIDKLQGH